MSTTVNPERERLLQELNQASQDCGNLTILFTNALASVLGLSAVEFEALSLLREGPLPAGRLAELCGLTTGGITGLVDRLERLGYARRAPDPNDRRRVIISHTLHEEFLSKASKLYEPVEDAFEALTKKYSLQELRTVLDYLAGANQMFERLTTDFYHGRYAKVDAMSKKTSA